MNDDALIGIYNELKTIRCLKQMELSLSPALTKTACSIEELAVLVEAIKNPVAYMETSAEDKKND